MSRFIYKVYIDDEFVNVKFTSINRICLFLLRYIKPEFWNYERQQNLVTAFKIPDFTTRYPQEYVDDSYNMKLKVTSEYLVYTGYINY